MHRNHVICWGYLKHFSTFSVTKSWPTNHQKQIPWNSYTKIIVRDASFFTKRTRVPDPYDALRREEQALREQGNVDESPLRHFDESTSRLNESSNLEASNPLKLKDTERKSVGVSWLPLPAGRARDDHDYFEPSLKSGRKVNPIDKLVDDTPSLAEFSDLDGDEDVSVATSASYPELLTSNGEPSNQLRCLTDRPLLRVRHLSALNNPFEKKYSIINTYYRNGQGMDKSRRRFAKEQRSAMELLNSVHPSHLSAVINKWKAEQEVLPYTNLLIGSLITSAAHMLTVLSALGEIDGDFDVRAKCLLLACFLYREDLLQNKDLMERFDNEIDKLRASENWPVVPLKIRYARLILWRSDAVQLQRLVSAYDTKYRSLSPTQCLFLTTLCLSRELVEEAVLMFQKMPTVNLAKPNSDVQRVCGMLIKRDMVIDTASGPNFRFLPKLLQKGLVPNGELYSCIIGRALELNFPGVAWDLFHHLQTVKREIDPRTYLLLLHHAFLNKNEQGVNEIMSEMHTQKALYTNPYLLSCAMNIIRYICFFHQKLDASEALSHMLALYDRAYTRAPLIRLGIVTQPGPRESVEQLPEPDTYMLCFTVWAYILCHHHIPTALKIWESIHHRIQKGDTTLAQCMTMDFFYNAYIILYRRKIETLPNALEILQYMLEKQWCLPSSRTWGLLICGYLRHGQRAEAQRLLDLMLAHGFAVKHVGKDYLPRGWTLEDLESMSGHFEDVSLMPDGTNPLRDDLLEEGHGLDETSVGLELNTPGVPGHEYKAKDDDFASSGPLSRLAVA